MRIKMLKSEKGFSIVELLMAITLLTIGLVAVAGMQSAAINSNGWANRLSTATSLAQEVMEETLAKDATDVIFSANTAAIDVNCTPGALTYDLCPDIAPYTSAPYNSAPAAPFTTCAPSSVYIPGAGTFSALRAITINNPVTGTVKIDVCVTDGTRIVTFTGYKRVI